MKFVRSIPTVLIAAASLMALTSVGCGGSDPVTTPKIQLVLNPGGSAGALYEDDTGWDFQIFFAGNVQPAAGGISVTVVDQYGFVYKKLDKAIPAVADGMGVAVHVPMPYEYPNLPAPGTITAQVWDGNTYDSSSLRDQGTYTLIPRGVSESLGTSGGGPLTKGKPTILWGVNPYIDPSNAGLVYEGNLDIWQLDSATASDTVQVEYGPVTNGTTVANTDFASVFLRSASTGAYVGQDVTRMAGSPATLKVPSADSYLLYIQYNTVQGGKTANYRVTWR